VLIEKRFGVPIVVRITLENAVVTAKDDKAPGLE